MKSLVKKKTIPYKFSQKHIDYIRKTATSTYNIAEGAIRAGKTVDNIYAYYNYLKTTRDKIHLASGSTQSTAKTIIGDSNGLGLEHLFRGQCKWGKFKGNEALIIKGPSTKNRTRIVIFVGGAKADSYKKFRGFSIGSWIATEINLHHIDTIKEAFNRTAAAKDPKFFWDLNPSPPKHFIYKDFIDKYREMAENGILPGGVNYEKFTLDDNLTIPEDTKARIKAQYDPTSIWYKRDILGDRVTAEGLIYRTFADDSSSFLLQEANKFYEKKVIGMDFGGNKSNHTLVCSGITQGFKELHALNSSILKAEGTKSEDITKWVVDFIIATEAKYGGVGYFYYDNAESVLGRDVEKAIREAGYLNMVVKGAFKKEVNDRIRATSILIDTHRFKYTKDCKTLEEALSNAVWDDKKAEEGIDERLDNGTSDIDTLDAFEYTFERDIKRLIERR